VWKFCSVLMSLLSNNIPSGVVKPVRGTKRC